MRVHSIDSETIEELRKLVAAMYGGRNDLYAAADKVSNEDLKEICRTLADDLAGDTAYLEQIIVSHGREPGFKEAVTSTLSEQIMQLFREGGDAGIVSQAKQSQTELRQRVDETIDATADTEVQSLLDQHKRHIEFAERVLRQSARLARHEH